MYTTGASVQTASTQSRDISTTASSERRADEMLAMVAHELRNPLAAMQYSLELLRGLEAVQRYAKPYFTMERQVALMVRVVNDLLELTRIDRGAFNLQQGDVDIAAVVGHALDICEPLIQRLRHVVSVRIQGCTPPVRADPLRLTQVLVNLLDNACKYTPPGGKILVETSFREGGALLSVSDNGIGIEPEMLDHVFDIYTRLPAGSNSAQGLGLGLALVKRLVEAHGGTVQARSDGANAGSTFIVRLPVAPVGATDPSN